MLTSQGAFRIITGLLFVAVIILGIKPEPARAQNTATYTVTFQGNWNAQSTPPGAPPGAHFTTLIGAVHNSQKTFWRPGGMATPGVERVAEFGATSGFSNELAAAGNNVKTIIRWGIGGGGGATVTRTVEFSKNHPLFTILSMLGPSPDWFVGLSSYSLLDGNGNWRPSHSVDLFAYDAGTEDGTEWSLNNPDTNPQGVISSLRGREKFTNVRVARMTFTLKQPVQPPGQRVSLSISGSDPVTEGTDASFTISANPAPSSNLTVNLNVSENSSNGRNFVASGNQGSKTVTIAANATSATYDVATVNDRTDEPNGSVTVTVNTGSGYTVGSSSSASVTVNDNDAAPTGIALSVSSSSVAENDGATTVTVTATVQGGTRYATAQTVAVAVAGSGGSDVVGFTPVAGFNITIPAEAVSASNQFTLTPRNNSTDEKNETLTVSGTLSGVTVTSATLTLTDDDVPTPSVQFASASGTADENAGTHNVTVNLSPVPPSAITLNYTVGGTATTADYTSLSGSVPVSANSSSVTIQVTITDDTEDEGNETIVLTLTSGTGYTVGSTSRHTLTITDNDGGGNGDGSDDDDAPPEFVATRFAFTLAENLVGPAPVRDAGGAIGVVHATGTGVTYTLASGGNNLFQVDAVTGAVYYVGPGEATGHYLLTVQATDSRGRVAETMVTVDVRNAATVARLNRAHRTVMPEAARLTAGSAFAAVSERLDATRTAARLRVAGYELRTATANLAGTLATGAALPNLSRILAGSEFVLPLSATGDAAGLAPVLWGSVDWTGLSGGRVTDWDGGMLNAHLGADVRLSERLLGGLALSHAQGTFDWTDQGGDPSVTGTYQSRMTSLMPYLGWTAHERLTGWAGATLGRGEVKLDDAAAGKYDGDATAWSAGAGARGTLLAAGQMVLALKGEAWVTQWEADGDGPLAALNAAAQRLRLALEGQQTWTLASGSVVVPELEVGVRHDGGDGETGTGLELGGGVRWSYPAKGLMMQARARTLLGRGSYRQWGVAGLVRIDPGADGQGLSLNVAPALGVAASGVARLWNEGVSGSPAAAATRYEPRLEAALGYGFAAPVASGTATPYAGFSLADTRAVTWRAGMRLAASAGLNAYLETNWSEPIGGTPDRGVILEVQRRF